MAADGHLAHAARPSPAVTRIAELLAQAGQARPVEPRTGAALRPSPPGRPAPVARRVRRPFTPEGFTLRVAGAGGFGVVEAALARKLATLAERPERLAVVVALHDERDARHYTQTLVDREAGAWVEAVSNAFLAEEHRLGGDQHRLLAALGFAPPTERVPNHCIVVDQPVDWSHVAGLLVQPLEAVYGASADAEVEVKVLDVGHGAPWLPEPVAADATSRTP